jgi:hypothetical protein
MVGIMENIYKEMRKRLALKNSQVDYNQAVDDMGNPIDRSVDLPEDNSLDSEKRLDKTRANEMNRMLSHLAVAAGPALSSFSPGTSAEQASRYKDSSNYLKNIGDIEGKAAKSLQKISNEEGLPEFIRTENSVGMEPYYQDKNNGTEKTAAKSFSTFDVYRPRNNERFNALFNTRLGVYTDSNLVPIKIEPTDIIKPVAEKLLKMKDMGGGERASLVSQYRDNPLEEVSYEPGSSSRYGVKTKGEADIIEKGLEAGAKETQDLKGKLSSINEEISVLKESTDERVISASVYKIARMIEPKGVFTDQDFKVLTGNSYRTWLKNLESEIATKGLGEIKILRDSFVPLAEQVRKEISRKLDEVPKRFATDTKKAQEAINSVLPKIDKKKGARLIDIIKYGEKKYGKGTDMYNKYIEYSKKELGL